MSRRSAHHVRAWVHVRAWALGAVALAVAGCETAGAPLGSLAPGAFGAEASPACADADADGFGEHCASGRDCDDATPSVTDECYRCAEPNEGCPCDSGASDVECGYAVAQEGSVVSCVVGHRQCVNSVWGPCAAEGTTTKTVAPPSLHVQGLTSPTPCTSNPCDPRCNDYDATPATTGSAEVGADGVTLVAKNGAGNSSAAACGTVEQKAKQIPLGMALMVDRSGSMEGSNWKNVKTALKAFVRSPAATGLFAGLDFFPSSNDECNGAQYSGGDVAAGIAELPGPENAQRDLLVNAIKATGVGGGTPMLPAVEGALLQASIWALGAPGRKGVVVLVTDGYPESCGKCKDKKGKDAKNLAACRIQEVATAVEAGFYASPPIETFVIGVGDNIDFLNIVARAGSGGRRNAIMLGGSASAEDIQAALDEVRNLSLSCEFAVPKPATGMIDPDGTDVTLAFGDGKTRTLDRVLTPAACGVGDGFYFDALSNKLLLCPTTCKDASADLKAEIQFKFRCYATCASVSARGEPGKHNLFVMMDRSGSMAEESRGTTLWAAASTAMRNFVRSPEVAGLGFGIEFFPPATDCEQCSDGNSTCLTKRDCNADKATCDAGCLDVQNQCHLGCAPLGDACRSACDGVRTTCNAACGPTQALCETGCQATLPGCQGICTGQKGACDLACGPAQLACNSGCGMTKTSCDTACADCKPNCDRVAQDCDDGCYDDWGDYDAQCGAACEATRLSCRVACGKTKDCKAGCTSAEATCTTGCQNTRNACPGLCSSQYATCNGNCQTTVNNCVSGCRATGLACPGKCDTQWTGCYGGCGATQAGCDAGCDTGGNNCRALCWQGFNACDPNDCVKSYTGSVPWPYCNKYRSTSCTSPIPAGPIDMRYAYFSGYSSTCTEADFTSFLHGGVPIGELPGPSNAHQLACYRALYSVIPEGGTPTRPAMSAALKYAKNHAAATPTEVTSVVLVTDGYPNDCSSSTAKVSDLAKQYFDGTPRVETFVIGVGSNLSGLNDVAMSGSGDKRNAFLVDTNGDPAQFTDSMIRISKMSMNCGFAVPTPQAGSLDLENPRVVITKGVGGETDLTKVASVGDCGSKLGWYYDNPAAPSTIQLCPTACEAVRTDMEPRVDVLYECLPELGAGGTAVFEFIAPECPNGASVRWMDWSWQASTPSNSTIGFELQTGDYNPVTKAVTGVSAPVPLLFTTESGGNATMSAELLALEGKQACAGNKSCPDAGAVDTQLGGRLAMLPGEVVVHRSLSAAGLSSRSRYLRIIAALNPSSDRKSAPTLRDWGLQATCVADR